MSVRHKSMAAPVSILSCVFSPTPTMVAVEIAVSVQTAKSTMTGIARDIMVPSEVLSVVPKPCAIDV